MWVSLVPECLGQKNMSPRLIGQISRMTQIVTAFCSSYYHLGQGLLRGLIDVFASKSFFEDDRLVLALSSKLTDALMF